MGKNIFNSIQVQRPNSNVFDLSHDVKLSLQMGKLVPINILECVPGDVIDMGTDAMLRMAPMIAPVMHKVDVYTHSFFVPNRLVWANWEKFITGGEDGTDPGPAFPVFAEAAGNVVLPGSLSDYLGLPIGSAAERSAIPYAAYNLIYNQYYRDQNLEPTESPWQLGDGTNPTAGYGELKTRAWQHDYFTAALPFAQKGAAVDIPISSGDLPIKVNTFGTAYTADTDVLIDGVYQPSASASTVGAGAEDRGNSDIPGGYLYADGAGATGASGTINDLRRAFRLQEWLEKNARAGSRYIESILSHFGVRSSDARLQRPEYIGGSKQPMIISEVLQTSESVDTPQGNMAGHGVSVGSGREFRYRCEEHGYVMTIMSIMPRTAYQQGVPRHWTKFDKLDYFWPTFAHLGEQEVKNKEIYFDQADGDVNEETFGYVPRYSEYRYLDSRVAGDFRTTLSYWHMGRIFTSRPSLNNTFIKCDPTQRIFAVEDSDVDKIYAHVFHRIKARRLMPKWGTPSF